MLLDYGYRSMWGALLLLIGLSVFARTMYVRFMLLKAVGQTSRWDLIEQRIKQLALVGLGQRKMFKEFKPGLTHALTFWGFCILGVRTTHLFVQAFAPDLMLPGALHPLYDAFKDVTELVVLAAVGMFVYRRLVEKPARIHYSKEALLILGFIGTLMVSDFLYDGLHFGGMAAAGDATALGKIATAPIGGTLARFFATSGMDPVMMQWLAEGFYWVHLMVILVFLNLLPISKHFHVITALGNVFLSNLQPKGALPLIENLEAKVEAGESLGIGEVRDLDWKQVLDLYTCTECGRCSVNCPAWNTDKPLNPALLIKDLQTHLLDNKDRLLALAENPAMSGELSEEEQEEARKSLPPLIAAVNADAIWSCTTCRSCSEQCPVTIEHVDKIIGIRRHLMLSRNEFPAELKLTLQNLENKSNPWGIASGKRAAWAKDRPEVPTLKEKPNPEWLYFVGCAGSFDDRAMKVTEAVIAILNAAEVDWAILGKKEGCSGDPARRMGHEYLFQEQAAHNIEQMNAASIKKVITTCPHCMNTIANEYPQLGGDYEVVHHSQLIHQLLRDGRLAFKDAARLRLTYHDPCYLGRYNDVYEAPREALMAVPGVEMVEMERSKQMGMCCGAGGARMFMEETIGSRVNHLRVEQAMETEPEVVAVGCPFCLTMVKDGLREKEIEHVQARDIAEIVADALVLPERPALPVAAEDESPKKAKAGKKDKAGKKAKVGKKAKAEEEDDKPKISRKRRSAREPGEFNPEEEAAAPEPA